MDDSGDEAKRDAAAGVSDAHGDESKSAATGTAAAPSAADEAAARAVASVRAMWQELTRLLPSVVAVTEEGDEDADAADEVSALARAVATAGEGGEGGMKAADDIEAACGHPLTPELRAYIEMVDVSNSCEALMLQGNYTLHTRSFMLKHIISMAGHDFPARHTAQPERYTPLELDERQQQVQFVWWDKGWVPFAQDSGGNLVCVDLHPGPRGQVGQVIGWEARMGPVGPFASSLVDYLNDALVDGLRSGATVFCSDSGGLVDRDDL